MAIQKKQPRVQQHDTQGIKGAVFKDLSAALARRGAQGNEQSLVRLPKLAEAAPWDLAKAQASQSTSAS
ncbi:hypothetical protein MMC29_004713 [Sticta canariensis]|nr:hypothetical protein [Sticta canariensis]